MTSRVTKHNLNQYMIQLLNKWEPMKHQRRSDEILNGCQGMKGDVEVVAAFGIGVRVAVVVTVPKSLQGTP